MYSFEVFILLISCIQPLLIGSLIFIGIGILKPQHLLNKLNTIRNRLTAYRFYECSTYSRLTSTIKYGSQFFTLFIAFLIYDVDLIFLLSEVIFLSENAFNDLIIIIVFILLFLLGLSYDKYNTGLN